METPGPHQQLGYGRNKRNPRCACSILHRSQIIRLGLGLDVPAGVLQPPQDQYASPRLAHRSLAHLPMPPRWTIRFLHLEYWKLLLFDFYGGRASEEWQPPYLGVKRSQWKFTEWPQEQEAPHQGQYREHLVVCED